MDDIDKIIKEILGHHNLSRSEGRDSAYEECIEFAETRLAADLRCNAFLRMAAQMLEKEPVEFDVIRDLVEIPEDAKLDIAYDDRHGFIVTANASGLEYLAELLSLLAEAPEGEHVHLFNDEEPLAPISFNAVIYHEEDDWFKRAEREMTEEAIQNPVRKRMIQLDEIFAIQIVGSVPGNLPIFRDKIYKVEKILDTVPDFDDDVEDDKIWRKACAGVQDRYVSIEIIDDNGDDIVLVVHLDDPDVIYFKQEDLDHLLG